MADEIYRVSSENDAWTLLAKLVSGEIEIEDWSSVKFDGWPSITINVPDSRLNSALTPYMMQGYVDFQRTVFRTHALLIHNAANARLLSDYEKQQLEIIVKVRKGSSDTESDLWEILAEIGSAAVTKMEPHHIIMTLLGLGVLWAGQSAFRVWLETRKDQKIAEIQSQQQKQILQAMQFAGEKDVERMQVFASAVAKTPKLDIIKSEDDDAKSSFTRHVSQNIRSSINGVGVEGQAAQMLSRASRTEAVEIRLDRKYRILRVDTTSPDGFKVRLEDAESGQTFDAGVQDALLSQEQKQVLQAAEWNKMPVFAEINARQRRGEIVDAVVINARQDDDDTQKSASE